MADAGADAGAGAGAERAGDDGTGARTGRRGGRADDLTVDVAVVGVGGAGVTLLHQLARHGPRGLRVALLDPVDRLRDRPADRTWCFWHDGPSEVDAAVSRSWEQVLLVSREGRRHRLDLRPLRYSMVASADLYGHVGETAGGLVAARVTEPVTSVSDRESGVVVEAGGRTVRARYAFDSRPGPPARPPRTRLLQHFHGELGRAVGGTLDPERPTLMDFRVEQPARGLAFGYLLPTGEGAGLVEYTEFSAAALPAALYAERLASYRELAGLVGWTAERTERGAIPMTDAVWPRRGGRHVFRLGTAGGATRASTGYTFAAMLRQGRAVARALAAGREPLPPPAYPRRHALLDAVLLRALADGDVDGPAMFERLFARRRPADVLRFLDTGAGLLTDARVAATAPWPPMLRAAARLTTRRRRPG